MLVSEILGTLATRYCHMLLMSGCPSVSPLAEALPFSIRLISSVVFSESMFEHTQAALPYLRRFSNIANEEIQAQTWISISPAEADSEPEP